MRIEPGKRCGNRDEVSLILANVAEEIGPLRGRGGLASKDFLGFGVENVGGEGELLLNLMGFEDFDFKVGEGAVFREFVLLGECFGMKKKSVLAFEKEGGLGNAPKHCSR